MIAEADDELVPYGNCLDEGSHMNDGDSSSVGGDSIPPPPPSKYHMNRSHETFDDAHSEHTLEEAIEVNDPSIETTMPRDNDDISNISVTFDPDYEVKDHHQRRNKILLIAACCVSFFIFVGLAAGLGSSAAQSKQQEQSSSFSELNESELNVDTGDGVADATIESPTGVTGEEEKEVVPTTNGSMLTEEEQAVWREQEAEGAAAAAQQETTDETTATSAENNIVPNVVTAPTDPSSTIETVIDNTDISATDGIISTATAVPTLYSSNKGTFDPDACMVDQIVASSHCENGVASTSVYMCLGRETPLRDQFWAWSEVPPAYARYVDRDWGWVQDAPSRDREITGLPNGRYVLGLYADGAGPIMPDYPLLSSTEFVVACGV